MFNEWKTNEKIPSFYNLNLFFHIRTRSENNTKRTHTKSHWAMGVCIPDIMSNNKKAGNGYTALMETHRKLILNINK